MTGLRWAAFAALLLAGCSGFLGLEGQTGLACTQPPHEDPNADQRDPFGPGEPFADRDPTTMAAGEVAVVAAEAGLEVTYRLSYGIGQPRTDPQGGYSECWCIPPPVGRVVDLGFDSGGRLIIFVDAGQTFEQVRAQPRMGWGCPDADA
jgi:hypothetical protein